jgi:hypothetical protein
MPAERLSMKKIRDVLRLTFELGLSRRNVSVATGIGRTAVTDYVQRAGAAGFGWPRPEGLDDAELERLRRDNQGETRTLTQIDALYFRIV